MALTTDQATRLALLLAARDSISMGQQVAEVEYAGQRTVYSKPNMDILDREILELQALGASPGGRTRGAIRFRRL